MADIRLIATDLDGTLLGEGSSMEVFVEFQQKLADLRKRQQVVWVISTGRSMRSFRHVYQPMQMLNLQPDYVILRHAFIFGVTRWGFVPHRIWNFWVRYRVWRDRVNVRREMDRWQKIIQLGYPGVKTVAKKATRLCLRFTSEKSAASAAAILRSRAAGYRHLQVFPYRQEVDVRRVPFTKGLSLAELALHLELLPDQLLAIGDGHNDVSMFEPSVAGMCGCPANAAPEIMKVVSERKGHIATASSLSGVLEVLNAFDGGEVRSSLPEGWMNPALMDNPMGEPRKRPKKHRGIRINHRKITLFVLTLVIAVMVFASFGLIPFSKILMKPFRLLEAALSAVFGWFMT